MLHPQVFPWLYLHDEKVNEKVNVSSKKVKTGSCEAVLSALVHAHHRHAATETEGMLFFFLIFN